MSSKAFLISYPFPHSFLSERDHVLTDALHQHFLQKDMELGVPEQASALPPPHLLPIVHPSLNGSVCTFSLFSAGLWYFLGGFWLAFSSYCEVLTSS